ncbi:hypothetical protein FIBSPDRAFT_856518 [Athelia psychrophila]|uniref:Uncharacterized protein n=1 Tax=Athelia psychrophila TaxID=1759441 RepID=A0A166N8D5_9AGAM|nr:hypothetical protein FIBSPDRAFT_856512 [Fibularhizoctonia sp. CBS 109695]KZP24751.1 hypothetical protein FIBSPDRAFT_856518 [Fibularhizoctonia sp. CBS 109695]
MHFTGQSIPTHDLKETVTDPTAVYNIGKPRAALVGNGRRFASDACHRHPRRHMGSPAARC